MIWSDPTMYGFRDVTTPVRTPFAGPVFAPWQNLPQQNLPFHNLPFQSVPFQSVPFQSVPFQSVPLQNVPLQSVPLQSVAFQNLPMQQLPMQNVPWQTMPQLLPQTYLMPPIYGGIPQAFDPFFRATIGAHQTPPIFNPIRPFTC